jgi:hypothetical protein
MKKITVLSATLTLVYLALAFIPSNLQAGWTRTYPGGEGYCVQQTSDGGYIITGSAWLLLKVDSLGDTMWTRDYDVASVGYSVQQTSDGGYLIAGQRKSGWFTSKFVLLKLDANADSSWVHTGSAGSQGSANWACETSDGGYIATGFPWILFRVDKWGDTLWTRQYPIESYCIRQTNDGGYILTGRAYNEDEEYEFGLIKTDYLGDTVWSFSDLSYRQCLGYCVYQNPNNSYIVAGRTENNLWLAKINSLGNLDWSFQYGPGEGRSVCRTDDGGFVVTGRVWHSGVNKLLLLKVDGYGELLWTRIFDRDSTSSGRSVQQTSDGGFIIAGYSVPYDTILDPWEAPPKNIWLLKTDSLGDTLEAAVAEQPVAVYPGFDVASPIGHQITLHYSNHPSGFHAEIFDASGRKVDEISAVNQSGSITWGEGVRPGVYFIREVSENPGTHKIILLR